MITVKEVSDLDIAFGGDMKKLLPAYEEIPSDFKDGKTKWNDVASDWFFTGLLNAKWSPNDGVDTTKALRHIKAILRSFEPQHEHKEAGVAYLLSQFFKDVTYERMK